MAKSAPEVRAGREAAQQGAGQRNAGQRSRRGLARQSTEARPALVILYLSQCNAMPGFMAAKSITQRLN